MGLAGRVIVSIVILVVTAIKNIIILLMLLTLINWRDGADDAGNLPAPQTHQNLVFY